MEQIPQELCVFRGIRETIQKTKFFAKLTEISPDCVLQQILRTGKIIFLQDSQRRLTETFILRLKLLHSE